MQAARECQPIVRGRVRRKNGVGAGDLNAFRRLASGRRNTPQVTELHLLGIEDDEPAVAAPGQAGTAHWKRTGEAPW
jgi:hypothetical protein